MKKSDSVEQSIAHVERTTTVVKVKQNLQTSVQDLKFMIYG